jgi:serine/arginine repetitive matrix protein 2
MTEPVCKITFCWRGATSSQLHRVCWLTRTGCSDRAAKLCAPGMYNGIGLSSVRGAGTSGHVTRNLATVRRPRRASLSQGGAAHSARARLVVAGAPAKRAHENRRRIEVAVAEREEELVAQGVDVQEASEVAAKLREELLKSDTSSEVPAIEPQVSEEGAASVDEKPAKEPLMPQVDIVKEEKIRRMRAALGISSDYKEGAAFQRMSRDKENQHEEQPGASVANKLASAANGGAGVDLLKEYASSSSSALSPSSSSSSLSSSSLSSSSSSSVLSPSSGSGSRPPYRLAPRTSSRSVSQSPPGARRPRSRSPPRSLSQSPSITRRRPHMPVSSSLARHDLRARSPPDRRSHPPLIRDEQRRVRGRSRSRSASLSPPRSRSRSRSFSPSRSLSRSPSQSFSRSQSRSFSHSQSATFSRSPSRSRSRSRSPLAGRTPGRPPSQRRFNRRSFSPSVSPPYLSPPRRARSPSRSPGPSRRQQAGIRPRGPPIREQHVPTRRGRTREPSFSERRHAISPAPDHRDEYGPIRRRSGLDDRNHENLHVRAWSPRPVSYRGGRFAASRSPSRVRAVSPRVRDGLPSPSPSRRFSRSPDSRRRSNFTNERSPRGRRRDQGGYGRRYSYDHRLMSPDLRSPSHSGSFRRGYSDAGSGRNSERHEPLAGVTNAHAPSAHGADRRRSVSPSMQRGFSDGYGHVERERDSRGRGGGGWRSRSISTSPRRARPSAAVLRSPPPPRKRGRPPSRSFSPPRKRADAAGSPRVPGGQRRPSRTTDDADRIRTRRGTSASVSPAPSVSAASSSLSRRRRQARASSPRSPCVT